MGTLTSSVDEEIIDLLPEWRVLTIGDLYRDLDVDVASSIEILQDEGLL